MSQDVWMFQYTLHSIYKNGKQSVHPVTVLTVVSQTSQATGMVSTLYN